jgi:hypothetical protein
MTDATKVGEFANKVWVRSPSTSHMSRVKRDRPQVTNKLVESVRNQAVGMLLIDGVTPDQQFIKIMYDELVNVMGVTQAPLARM